MGKPYAGFDEAGAGGELIPSTAPALDPTDEGELEIERQPLRQLPTLPRILSPRNSNDYYRILMLVGNRMISNCQYE